MITTNTPLLNYQFVSLQANSLQERYYFPDLPNLREAKVYRIVTYNESNFTNDINNVALVNSAAFSSSYITINSNGLEVIQKLDLTIFKTITSTNNNTNLNGSFDLLPMNIDFSKSYVQLSNPSVISITFPFVYAFGIYYSK
jgi:hypothetical protein